MRAACAAELRGEYKPAGRGSLPVLPIAVLYGRGDVRGDGCCELLRARIESSGSYITELEVQKSRVSIHRDILTACPAARHWRCLLFLSIVVKKEATSIT